MAPCSRRTALQHIAAATGWGWTWHWHQSNRQLAPFMASIGQGAMKLGLIADVHIGLADGAEKRLDAFLANPQTQHCDAIVQLGDFAFPNEDHAGAAEKFNAAKPESLHVIGNHDLDLGLSREDCQQVWGIPGAYYERRIGGLIVLVLDGNCSGSPDYQGGYPSYVGPEQREWLEARLQQADRPVLIFSHQPLAGWHAVDDADKVQQLLTKFNDKILLCINGHTHVDTLEVVGRVPCLHLNSASYFWVGGEQRMAHYWAPLYAYLTIDFEQQTVQLEGRRSQWRGPTPEDAGYFEGKDDALRKIVSPLIRDRKIVRKVSR